MEEIVFRPGSVEENDQFKREAIKLSLAGVGVSLGAFTVSIAEEDYSTTSKCSWFRVASDENRRYLVKYVGSELEFVGTEHDLPNRDLHVLKKLPLEIPEVSCTLHWSSDLKLMLNDREVTVLHMYHHNVDLCSDAPFGLRDIKAEDLDFIEALRVPSQDRGDLLALFCNRWVYGPCPVAAFLHVQTAVIYLWQSGIWDYPEGLCIRQCGDDFEMLTTYGSSYVTPIWAATSYDHKAKCNWIASNSEWTPLEIPSEFCSLHDWIVFGVTWSDFPLSEFCQYDTPRNTNQTLVPFESFRVSIASHSLRDLDKKDADVQKRVMQLYLDYAAHYEKWLRLGPGKDQSEPWSRGLKASEILNHNVACVLVMLGRIEEAYRQLVKDRSFLQVWASTEELRDDPALNPVKDLALKSL